MKQYVVTGMTCAACQARVEKVVSNLPNTKNVSVSLLTNSMSLEGDVSDEDVIKAVENAGYGAKVKGASENKSSNKLEANRDALKDRETPKLKKRLLKSSIVLIILMYITMGHNMLNFPLPSFLNHNHIGLAILQMLLAIVAMYINKAFFISGFKSLMHKAPNMDTLVALGSSVSFGWSLYILFQMTILITNGASNQSLMNMYHSQLYFESAAMIPVLITVGKTLESLSKGKTTDALKHLMDMAPKKAVLIIDDNEVEVSIDDVNVGDVFIVKPGESIPVDGVIIEGESAIDESALTGESIPVDKKVDDLISAATVNQSGFIKAKATRVGEDTTFSQIIQMVSDAAATKAPIARIADKVSGVFVPTIILLAIVVAIFWIFMGRGITFSLERAISVLVIACPCSLGLATPVAIMVGSGMGAKNGILFKTSTSLEKTGKIQIVALDKTGTITAGKPEVTDIYPSSMFTKEELIKYAYNLELKSEHPLAYAIVEYGDKLNIIKEDVSSFKTLTGNGLKAVINNHEIIGGSYKYILNKVKIEQSLQEKSDELSKEGKTPLFFMKDNEILGLIAVADVIKEDSIDAIKELKAMGIEVVMLTGDNRNTANAVGSKAGIDHVIADVMPSGKEAIIRKLQESGLTAMVGDGINDAPALTRADIGIAIGAGTDVAIESADVVLMNSSLKDATGAIRLSRATLRNIYQNLFWAFAYNIMLIPMAAGLYKGIEMNPMWGAAAMAISSFTVCLNALRLNLFKVHNNTKDHKMRNRAHLNDNVTFVTNENKKENITMEKTLKIEGMMCTHCEARVKKALEGVDGVTKATVSHENDNATVVLDKEVSNDVLTKAVENQDYKVVEISQ